MHYSCSHNRFLSFQRGPLFLFAAVFFNAMLAAQINGQLLEPEKATTTEQKKQTSSNNKKDIVLHKNAHAHNDYLHKRPLLDALDNGFCSVEADVFLVEGQLLVAHTFLGLQKERTLQSLYLEPLNKRIQENKGHVHKVKTPFILLIDIKTKSEPTYNAIHKALAQYPEVFSHLKNEKWHERPITAIISGSRPARLMMNQKTRFAGIDGRLSDLKSTASENLIPLISDSWRNHFRWNGTGPFPRKEREKLLLFVKQAKKQKRKLRFWGIPDRSEVWSELHKAKVNLIGTDKLKELNAFLRNAKR